MARTDVAFIGGRGFFSNYGGVENAIREIVTVMARIGDITISVYGIPNEKQRLLDVDNVSLISVCLWIYRLFGQHGMILACVLHTILVERPKVVILFASGPCIFTPLIRLFGIKVITSLRAVDSERGKWGITSRKILSLGEYFSWRFGHEFTVNSLEMQRRFSIYRPNVQFIPNGASPGVSEQSVLDRYGLKKGQYFFFAARFDPVKRLHVLLEAYKGIENNTAFKLVIAGGNAKDVDYERRLKSFESEKVKFIGHIPNETVDALMVDCKAFILPSVLEGMSNSLLSAMINGRPVLAADIPENKDVLISDDAVFKADDVEELQKGLIRLYNDEFCLNLGSRLRNHAEANYCWESTASKFYSLIKRYI